VFKANNERVSVRRSHKRFILVHPKQTTFSPHTSCEIIHYSIQLSESFESHYMILITPG